jgi:hypothetical protein
MGRFPSMPAVETEHSRPSMLVSSPQNEQHRALIDLSFSDEPRLAALANSIVNASWFKTGAMEPVVETTDEVVKDKIVRPGESRFRAFLEMTPTRTYKCQFVTENGRCERTEERLDRAQGHARQHLDYRPYVCGGKCARPDWYDLTSITPVCAHSLCFHS